MKFDNHDAKNAHTITDLRCEIYSLEIQIKRLKNERILLYVFGFLSLISHAIALFT